MLCEVLVVYPGYWALVRETALSFAIAVVIYTVEELLRY